MPVLSYFTGKEQDAAGKGTGTGAGTIAYIVGQDV